MVCMYVFFFFKFKSEIIVTNRYLLCYVCVSIWNYIFYCLKRTRYFKILKDLNIKQKLNLFKIIY